MKQCDYSRYKIEIKVIKGFLKFFGICFEFKRFDSFPIHYIANLSVIL